MEMISTTLGPLPYEFPENRKPIHRWRLVISDGQPMYRYNKTGQFKTPQELGVLGTQSGSGSKSPDSSTKNDVVAKPDLPVTKSSGNAAQNDSGDGGQGQGESNTSLWTGLISGWTIALGLGAYLLYRWHQDNRPPIRLKAWKPKRKDRAKDLPMMKMRTGGWKPKEEETENEETE